MPNTLTLLPGRLEAWIGGRIGRLLFALPPGILRRLAGTPPAEATGIHPEALLLGRLAAAGPDRMSDAVPVAEQRRRFALQAGGLASPGADALPVAVSDHRAPGRGGDVPVRLYVPEAAEARGPLLVYFHGGGWVLGGLDAIDVPCRTAGERSAACVVLSVDYRLAPEHRFPIPVEDASTARPGASPSRPSGFGVDPRQHRRRRRQRRREPRGRRRPARPPTRRRPTGVPAAALSGDRRTHSTPPPTVDSPTATC